MDYKKILEAAWEAEVGRMTEAEAVMAMVKANAPTHLIREVFGYGNQNCEGGRKNDKCSCG